MHGSGSKCEPNLIPLLDVVFQLLMFFMMCIRLVNDENREEIMLPLATSLAPVQTDPDSLIVNCRPFHLKDFERKVTADTLEELRQEFKEGEMCMYMVGDKKPKRLDQFRFWLKTEYENAERSLRLQNKQGKVNTLIVLRADEASTWGKVFEVMQKCRDVGYTRLRVQGRSENKPKAN